MYHQRYCSLCDQSVTKLPSHIVYEHGMLYQQYCEKEYGISTNINVYITPKVIDFILQYCKENNIDAKDIKKHLVTIFMQNQYEADKLVKIFQQYTYAIAQYFNLTLLNVDKYLTNMITLKESKSNKLLKEKQREYTENRRKKYDSNVKIINCKICGSECNEKNLLTHVATAHKMVKKDYLIKYYNVPKDMNFTKLTAGLVFKMFEELEKSPFDNLKDCYQSLYDQVHNYTELNEMLGYKANAICEGLHLDLHREWTPEQKIAQSKRKMGTKWSSLQRQRILESKGLIPKE